VIHIWACRSSVRRDPAVRVGLKIHYRNPRRPGEAGMKLVPDPSQGAAEKEVLERLGFTVIEITPVPSALGATPGGILPRTLGG
jgi:hypothetical protein